MSVAVETRAVEDAPATAGPAALSAALPRPRRASRIWRYALLRRLLACADLVAAFAVGVSVTIAGEGSLAQLSWTLLFLPAWVIVAKVLGLYDRDEPALRHLTVDEVPQLVLWSLIGTSSLSFFLGLTPAGRPHAPGALTAGVVGAATVLLLRTLVRWIWRRATPTERIAIVGPRQTAGAVRRKVELFPDLHMTVVDEREELEVDAWRDRKWVARVDRLVFAPRSLDDGQIRQLLELSRAAGVVLTVVPPTRGAFGPAAQLHRLADLPLLSYRKGSLSRSTLLLKRTLDIAVSVSALVVLLPFFALIAAAIRLESPGPVLFRQVRAGQHARPFRMLKFRSMVDNAEELLPDVVALHELDEPMFKLQDDPRRTQLGRVLRRWSLDELPQFWNVLVGDMSLVGPRPEQLDLVHRYSDEHRFRLEVKPGLTGPMQVYGRGRLSFAERLAVERDYIENLSVVNDLRILGLTVAAVLGSRGAY